MKHIRHDVAVEPFTAPHDGHFQNEPTASCCVVTWPSLDAAAVSEAPLAVSAATLPELEGSSAATHCPVCSS